MSTQTLSQLERDILLFIFQRGGFHSSIAIASGTHAEHHQVIQALENLATRGLVRKSGVARVYGLTPAGGEWLRAASLV